MPVTYTNRKGVTYTLYRGTTKTGKPRYFFSREAKGEPLDRIPAGWKISESPNGIVSLVRDRPAQIRPEEVAVVEAAIKRHPKSRNYRVAVKGKQILVYESTGPDAEEILRHFEAAGLGRLAAGQANRLQETLDRGARFEPVLRFTLRDAQERTFHVERMCYLGSIDDWVDLFWQGKHSLKQLVQKIIPSLGTDKFFELGMPHYEI